MFEVLLYISVGIIAGLIAAEYLPDDVTVKINQDVKVKNSTLTDSEIFGDLEKLTEDTPRKPGLLKRIFKRKKSKQ